MKRNKIGLAVLAIAFAVFQVVAFAVPAERTASYWVTYVFACLSILAQIPIWKIGIRKDGNRKKAFLGIPVLWIGYTYAAAQIGVFLKFLWTPGLPVWIAWIVCAGISGGMWIYILLAVVARDAVARKEEKIQQKTDYLKTLQAEISCLEMREQDTDVRAALRQLAEKIRFSDPMSSDALLALEAQIRAKIAELPNAPDKLSLIRETEWLLAERNERCKTLKGTER